MQIEVRACAIVADALKMQRGVTIDDTMATLASWDSLAHMSVVLAIEAEIGRQLTGEEIASITSVQTVARLLEATGSSAKSAS
ncbi:MAG: acyl carrier protein [Notoacmeibacter sp.]|nr:acyl carrier protein [Notoacmeibacter sp.]